MSVQKVYLDHNATTPLDPRVLESMLPFFNERFGNAASKNHSFGWEANDAVEQAREQIASLINAKPKEIFFTSGATESNNLALKGIEGHLITCVTEHNAILDPAKILKANGRAVTILNVDEEGLIDLRELEDAFTKDTAMVSIMYANNETGVIQPIEEIARIAKKRGALFMTDATQAVGKLSVDVEAQGIDLLSLSAHKMYGPKGCGALYVRSGIKLESQIDGGGHERGIRSGTLNVPGIVGLGKACELCHREMEQEARRLKLLRDRLEGALLMLEHTRRNGNSTERLPHVTNISFGDLDGEKLTLALHDVAVSQGSACTSATVEPSHVLSSMGLSGEQALGSIRFGLGRFTTQEEIDFAIERVKQTVREVRGN